jgi:hypothetical protein
LSPDEQAAGAGAAGAAGAAAAPASAVSLCAFDRRGMALSSWECRGSVFEPLYRHLDSELVFFNQTPKRGKFLPGTKSNQIKIQ